MYKKIIFLMIVCLLISGLISGSIYAEELSYGEVKIEIERITNIANNEERLEAYDNLANKLGFNIIEEEKTDNIKPDKYTSQKSDTLFLPRNEAIKIIKKNAKEKWEDDYEMVNYQIENQTEAYDWLVKQKGYLDIMKKAKEKWEKDYEMIKYEYKKQVEAYEKL